MTVEIRLAVSMPWAIGRLKRVRCANSAERCIGFMSPESVANASISASLIVFDTCAVAPTAGTFTSQTLDRERCRSPSAVADGRDAALASAQRERVEQRHDDARAGRAERMAQRDRAAVDVELVVRNVEQIVEEHVVERVRLVVLEQIEVADGHAQLLQQPFYS